MSSAPARYGCECKSQLAPDAAPAVRCMPCRASADAA
jgi:hypothetical protein